MYPHVYTLPRFNITQQQHDCKYSQMSNANHGIHVQVYQVIPLLAKTCIYTSASTTAKQKASVHIAMALPWHCHGTALPWQCYGNARLVSSATAWGYPHLHSGLHSRAGGRWQVAGGCGAGTRSSSGAGPGLGFGPGSTVGARSTRTAARQRGRGGVSTGPRTCEC